MAQAPAIAKWRRVMLRLLTRIVGPNRAGRFASQPSEQAALALRNRRVEDLSAEEVVFLIPLVGRHHVRDWSAVEARLTATLQGFQTQSDPRWRAVICGQDQPETLTSDPRIRFLPFAGDIEGNDKWPKLQSLVAALPDPTGRPVLVMPFDADDLLHPMAVERMLAGPASRGCLFAHGYIHDVAAGRTGRAGPASLNQPLRKPFWKLCGSCAAFPYIGGDVDQRFLTELVTHEHRMFPYLAKLAERPLAHIPDPLVLYMLNHGENFGQRRGRIGFKPRFVARFEVKDEKEHRQIVRHFPAAFE
jgi:hypothetical protein